MSVHWLVHDDSSFLPSEIKRGRREEAEDRELSEEARNEKFKLRAFWRGPIAAMTPVTTESRRLQLLNWVKKPWFAADFIVPNDFSFGTPAEATILFRYKLEYQHRVYLQNGEILPLDPINRLNAVFADASLVSITPFDLHRRKYGNRSPLEPYEDHNSNGLPWTPFVDLIECHIDAKQLYQSLSPQLQGFVADYKLNDWNKIRPGARGELRPDSRRYFDSRIDAIGAAIVLNELCYIGKPRGLPDRFTPIIAYHGVEAPDFRAYYFDVGRFANLAEHVSTTLNPEVALKFISSSNTVLQIELPPGAPFFNYNYKFTEFSVRPQGEEELLLPFSCVRFTNPEVSLTRQLEQLDRLITLLGNPQFRDKALARMRQDPIEFYVRTKIDGVLPITGVAGEIRGNATLVNVVMFFKHVYVKFE